MVIYFLFELVRGGASKREKQTCADLTATLKKKSSSCNFNSTDGSTIFSETKKSKRNLAKKKKTERRNVYESIADN